MINQIKNDARFKVLFTTILIILVIAISSLILDQGFKNVDLKSNDQYQVSDKSKVKPGNYLIQQEQGSSNKSIVIENHYQVNQNHEKLNEKFAKLIGYSNGRKDYQLNFSSEQYQTFKQDNPKVNIEMQIQALANKLKSDVLVEKSFNIEAKAPELIDTISLKSGDVVKAQGKIELRNRFAPKTLFFDNSVNAMTWVTFQAGVVVPLSMFIINYAFYLTKYGFTKYMRRSKHVQLTLSSLLGACPGDSTTLVLFPFYFRKIISWGALVSLGISGIGDAGFVLMTNRSNIYGEMHSGISMFMAVMVIKIIIAFLIGFFLIKFNVDPKLKTNDEVAQSKKAQQNENLDMSGTQIMDIISDDKLVTHGEDLEVIELAKEGNDDKQLYHMSYLEGSEVDMALNHSDLNQTKRINILNWLSNNVMWLLFWVIELIKYAIYFANGADVDDESSNPTFRLLAVATAIIIIIYWYVLALQKSTRDSISEVEASRQSLKQTIVHSTDSSVNVMFRVIIIMSIYKILVFGIIGDSNVQLFFSSFSQWWILALLGVVVGFIPGCQLQIAFQTVGIALGWPLPAILANATSQIGDSAFSFLTVSRKAWLYLASANALVALIVSFSVGIIMYGHF